MKTARFLFLGTGGSMGIPVVGCQCAVCISDSPCNQRLRPSALVFFEDKKFLIDSGPDFRRQALEHRVDHLDGLLLTHAHHDHIAGLDELRVFYMRSKKELPCLLSKQTFDEIRRRYTYLFEGLEDRERVITRLSPHLIEGVHGEVVFEGLPVKYVSYEQLGMRVNGFIFGDLAYISDIFHYSDAIFDHLKGINTLILSALRMTPSLAHLSIDQAVAFANRVGAHQTWLTHIAHELDHETTNSYLPSNVRMAYDGLELQLTLP